MDLVKQNSSDLEALTVGNVDGLLVEPINPSLSISSKYYLDDVTRLEILGSLRTDPKLTIE